MKQCTAIEKRELYLSFYHHNNRLIDKGLRVMIQTYSSLEFLEKCNLIFSRKQGTIEKCQIFVSRKNNSFIGNQIKFESWKEYYITPSLEMQTIHNICVLIKLIKFFKSPN